MNNEILLKEVSKKAKILKFSLKKHKSYLYKLADYIQYFKSDIKNSKTEHIEKYMLHLINKDLPKNTIDEILASLHFAFNTILKLDIVDLNKFKKNLKLNSSKKLPEFLTKKQIGILLETIDNKKDKLIISLIYSTGIKISEFSNLKKEDINLEKNLIKISKKKKSRNLALSVKIKKDLEDYLSKNKTKYLFENKLNNKYSSKSIKYILKFASINLPILATPNMLRHSFAIHQIENGIDLKIIQKLLGHSNIRSTLIYSSKTKINLENIKSLLD